MSSGWLFGVAAGLVIVLVVFAGLVAFVSIGLVRSLTNPDFVNSIKRIADDERRRKEMTHAQSEEKPPHPPSGLH